MQLCDGQQLAPQTSSGLQQPPAHTSPAPQHVSTHPGPPSSGQHRLRSGSSQRKPARQENPCCGDTALLQQLPPGCVQKSPQQVAPASQHSVPHCVPPGGQQMRFTGSTQVWSPEQQNASVPFCPQHASGEQQLPCGNTAFGPQQTVPSGQQPPTAPPHGTGQQALLISHRA